METLHRDPALFAEDEWFWREERAGAYVFASHAAAEIQAAKMPYEIPGVPGTHLPFAVVCGSPSLDAQREARARERAAWLDAIEAEELHVPRVSAADVFERLEKERLA